MKYVLSKRHIHTNSWCGHGGVSDDTILLFLLVCTARSLASKVRIHYTGKMLCMELTDAKRRYYVTPLFDRCHTPNDLWVYTRERYVDSLKWRLRRINSLPDASFGLRVLSSLTSVTPCLRVYVYVYACVNPELVRAIAYHPFKLGSPNLDHMRKIPWLRSLLFCRAIDLDLQGEI